MKGFVSIIDIRPQCEEISTTKWCPAQVLDADFKSNAAIIYQHCANIGINAWT